MGFPIKFPKLEPPKVPSPKDAHEKLLLQTKGLPKTDAGKLVDGLKNGVDKVMDLSANGKLQTQNAMNKAGGTLQMISNSVKKKHDMMRGVISNIR